MASAVNGIINAINNSEIFENKCNNEEVSEPDEQFPTHMSPRQRGIDLSLSSLAKQNVSRLAPPLDDKTALSSYKIKDVDNKTLNRHIQRLCSGITRLSTLEPALSSELSNEPIYKSIINASEDPDSTEDSVLLDFDLDGLKEVPNKRCRSSVGPLWSSFNEDNEDSSSSEHSEILCFKGRPRLLFQSSLERPRLFKHLSCPSKVTKKKESWRDRAAKRKRNKLDSSNEGTYGRFASLFQNSNVSHDFSSRSLLSGGSSNKRSHVEEEEICCPDGHALIENKCAGPVSCEKCDKDFVQGTKMFSCRIDDYDECESCYLDRLVKKDGTLFVDPKRGNRMPSSIRPNPLAFKSSQKKPASAASDGLGRPRLRNTKSVPEEIIHKQFFRRRGRESLFQSRWVPRNDLSTGEMQWKRVFNEEPDKTSLEIFDDQRKASVVLSCCKNMRVGELFNMINRLSHGTANIADKITFSLIFNDVELDPNCQNTIESFGMSNGSKVFKRKIHPISRASPWGSLLANQKP